MASLGTLLALAPLLIAGVDAQSFTSNVKVWAAVAYINHGEKTPAIGGLEQILTPQGAQQMLRQGAAFRDRYLDSDESSRNGSTGDAVESAIIQGLSEHIIDNSQLAVFTQPDEWTAASAFAFLQGLYPPNEDSFNSAAGGSDLANNYADNLTTINYPMNGYQYPRVLPLTRRDRLSTGIQGTVGCDAWSYQMLSNLTRREDMAELSTETYSFYQELFSTPPLVGTLPLEDAHFWRAQEIYEFVNYMYAHNETVHDELEDAFTTLTLLRQHAIALERAQNSNPVANSGDSLNDLYTIAGRTLARFISDQFTIFMDHRGEEQKLTLLFGSYTPFLSFLNTAGFTSRESLISGPNSRIPAPGSAMVFELVGDDTAETLPFAQDLRIRFYYRANSNEDERFVRESLFSSGFGGSTIPFTAFTEQMERRGRTSNDWCHICQPSSFVTAPWCAVNATGSSTSSSSSFSPAIAGVIGAIAMAVLVGLILVLLFFIFGFRFRRDGPHERRSSLGGFKGAEKMASDTDLAVTKRGAAQERIGSWELREENPAPPPTAFGAGIITKDFHRHTSRELDEDRIDMVDRNAVKAHETI